ncbi:MAG: non-homologous end-joining DNA ligase, partial [Aeromicrobium sp.]
EEANIDLAGSQEAPLPDFVEPMKATSGDKPFDDPDWMFELKLDGYRIEAVVDNGKVRLWTRNKQDAARYFPDLASAKPTWINADTAIVDGEVVALDAEGRPTFSLLQDRAGMGRFGPRPADANRSRKRDDDFVAPVVYYVFDLIYHDGRLLTDVPLEQRKRLLRSVLREHNSVRFGSHVDGDGKALYDVVAEQGLEGLIAKLRTSRYEPGRRSKSWLKVKIRREQEVVVVGYEPGKGARADLGSLILGVHEGDELRYVGEVGSGLDARTIRQLKAELDAHRVDEPPVVNAPRIKGAVWSQPRLVVRVEFSEWTDDGLLRQAAYKGLEIGKGPRAVVREREISARRAATAAEKEVATFEATAKTSKSSAQAEAAAEKRSAARSKSTTTSKSSSGPRSAIRSKSAAGSKSAVQFFEDSDDRSDPPQAATEQEMAALEALEKEGSWEIGGHSVNLTNLDKVLFPGPDFTKRDLIRYYVTVAPVILPHLRERALNLSRWPDGVDGKTFWQKQIPHWAPDWISRWDYPDAGSSESHTYLVADRVATMAWLANHATIDLHPWTSKIDTFRNPTYALIDIDPGTKTTFDEVVALSRIYRTALEHLGVVGLPKVTGKRGIQVWVPISPKYTYQETSQWVEALSRAVGSTVPHLV